MPELFPLAVYPFSYGAPQDQHADPETISELLGPVVQNIVGLTSLLMVKNVNCSSICLFYGFMAQSTHWGHVELSQFT